MSPLRATLAAAALTVPLAACQSSEVGPNDDCAPPTLSVAGQPHRAAGHPVVVHPGQTLRLQGRSYAFGCKRANEGGVTQHAFSEVELVWVARYRTFALAKAHPRGPTSTFTVPVTVPTDALAGKAQIRDQLGFPLGVVRLVVRP